MTKNRPKPQIKFSDGFNKELKAAPREIRQAFFDTLQLFTTDPFHPFLRNHVLKRKLAGIRSIDITADYRALYKTEPGGIITFIALGTHDELYK